jgi:hypothetical protein
MSDTSPIAARSNGEARGVRLWSVRRLDGRTKAAKRIKGLVEHYASALGGWQNLSPIRRQEVERAGTLTVIAEIARERFMLGEDISLDDVVRAERLALHAMRRLGIRQQEPPRQTLSQYLAERGAR